MNLAAIFLALTAVTVPSYGLPDVSGAGAPPIAVVQRKAIEYARIDPSEISKWKKKARTAALLPKLQVEYDRRVKYDVNVDVTDTVYVGSAGATVGPGEGSYAANQNNDQNVIVKAVWSLPDTIFSTDLLAVSEEARLLSRERHAILAEVNKNYYERERLEAELKVLAEKLKRDPRLEKIKQEILSKRISLDESTAALDALTGGWFGEEVKANSEQEGKLEILNSKQRGKLETRNPKQKR